MIKEVDFQTFLRKQNENTKVKDKTCMRLKLLLARLERDKSYSKAVYWNTIDNSEQAILYNGHLIFGDVCEKSCEQIANSVDPTKIRKLSGSKKIVDKALSLFHLAGVSFSDPMHLSVMSLTEYPKNITRVASPEWAQTRDVDLITEWLGCFMQEALPNQKNSAEHNRSHATALIENRKVALVRKEHIPVAIAAIVNEGREITAISLVYTPPEFRNRGYAAEAVYHLAEHILGSGRIACLFIDSNNPASRKCYEKLGFKIIEHHCEATLLPS